jgi:hypothetical protein
MIGGGKRREKGKNTYTLKKKYLNKKETTTNQINPIVVPLGEGGNVLHGKLCCSPANNHRVRTSCQFIPIHNRMNEKGLYTSDFSHNRMTAKGLCHDFAGLLTG